MFSFEEINFISEFAKNGLIYGWYIYIYIYIYIGRMYISVFIHIAWNILPKYNLWKKIHEIYNELL